MSISSTQSVQGLTIESPNKESNVGAIYYACRIKKVDENGHIFISPSISVFHKHIEDNAPKFVLCVYAFTLTYSKRGNNYNKKVINFPGGKAQHPSPLAFCRFKRLYPKM
ncbi:4082_t:CDS:2 [Rhizophagus irregularis]|nr:4082_t:CDS:2 [Rhizophagus irregularis]